MLFTVDAGNTNTTFALFLGNTLVFESRISTNVKRMCDEYTVILSETLRLNEITADSITGAVISSVVPSVTSQLEQAIKKLCDIRIMFVEPGLKTGLNIKLEEAGGVGSDLISVCVGAKAYGKFPTVIVDAGTVTKLLALDETGAFIGGTLFPGVENCVKSLGNAALLPDIGLDGAKIITPISGNTLVCMRSGVILGCADMVNGMIARFEEKIGAECFVIGTGGNLNYLYDYIDRDIEFVPHLISDGLRIIYERNLY
jgi:type III pantothenate kinase